MMLATWLVEFYLSGCNELDDLVASESVSQDVANLQAQRTILEDDLRHFFDTYRVCLVFLFCPCRINIADRITWNLRLYTSSSKGMDERTCICTTQQSSGTTHE